MASEQPSRDAFIAAIEAKIAAWTAVLNSYKAAVSLDGPVGDLGVQGAPVHSTVTTATTPADLPIGVFRDKSIREAIEIYLGAGRRKQTNKEIASGLQKGGIATTSANFEGTIATALGRMKDDGVVLRFQDGWDLAASYPDSLRGRLQKDAKPKRSKRTGKKSARAAKPEKAAKPKDKGDGELSIDQRILALLREGGPSTPADLSGRLNAKSNVIGLALGRLAFKNKVTKSSDGKYTVANTQEPVLRAV